MATTDTNYLTSSPDYWLCVKKTVSLSALIKIKLSLAYLVAEALRIPVL